MRNYRKHPSPQQLKIIDKLSNGKLFSSVLPPNASLADRFKHDLCARFIVYKRENDLKQKELGDLLGIDEARVSEIVHYKIDKFTADKLMDLLEKLVPKIHFRVS